MSELSSAHPCPPQQHGVLVLNKPKGPTSTWCIGRIKRMLGQKKIGHAGTLDPLAQGVLLVLLGQATKLSGHLMDDGEKVYSGSIRLGLVTDTWDILGATLGEKDAAHITQEDIERAFAPFVGTHAQQVPAFSAAKHQGKPLYELARKGAAVPVKEKTVTITRGEAELVGPARIRFRVACSSGTYIRSLAHSLGNRLGCGACLEELIREHSHPFGLEQAHELDAVLAEPECLARRVVSIADALPGNLKIRLTEAEALRVRNGHSPEHNQSFTEAPFVPGTKALLLDPSGEPLALAQSAVAHGLPVWTLVRGLWNL